MWFHLHHCKVIPALQVFMYNEYLKDIWVGHNDIRYDGSSALLFDALLSQHTLFLPHP